MKRIILLALAIGLAMTMMQSNSAWAGVNANWTYRWDGPGGQWDRPYAMVRAGDYIYVTGATKELVHDHPDFATFKFDFNGNLVWDALWAGEGPEGACEGAWDIAVDDSGNVYITGPTDPTVLRDDFATVKYDADGNEQWVTIYPYPDDLPDVSWTIAVDDDGNVFSAGYVTTVDNYEDLAVVKHYPNGDTAWVRTYDHAGQRDQIWDNVTDSDGNMYGCGFISSNATFRDAMMMKYDPNGNILWMDDYDGPAGELDEFTDLVYDVANGFIYVTGYSYGVGIGKDVLTAKYDLDGNRLWLRRHDGSAQDDDRGQDIALDPAGNVFVAGSVTETGTNKDYALLKYNANGDFQWIRTLDVADSPSDEALSVAVDINGDVSISGSSGSVRGDLDVTTAKYTNDGDMIWSTSYNGPGSGRDLAPAVVVDDVGNTYVVSESDGGATDLDVTLIKYSYTEPICGDVDGNGIINVSDDVYLLNFIFGDGNPPNPMESADVDCNGLVNISDAVWLVNFVFGDGDEPCANCP
jgi:hypothetical protein